MLAQVERLSTYEKAMLFQFFDESDDLNDHILTPRADSLQGPELETLLADLSFRRQMASVLTEFDPENFAQRVFGTVSALFRVTEKLRRVQAELKVQVNLFEMPVDIKTFWINSKREFQLGITSRDQRITNLEVEKTEIIRNFREDTLKLLQEHDRDKRGLRTQAEDLRLQVEMEKSRRQTWNLNLLGRPLAQLT
ncbi:hypothetical protein P3T76_012190 [Phytophthora citrophthora]|uniref:Uncharacterized protein n=1 Tax=Phytophthora citrophthora TaxID=4793 RepID=A0AAD9G689_9STRA|nr:hypothetical protein P3T76_012190 [Phytophthora citrophthora]